MRLLTTIVLVMLLAVLPASAEIEDPSESLIELYQEEFSAFRLVVDLQITMQRGPLEKKLFRTTEIHLDEMGSWHMLQKNPLSQENWEIYWLHGFENRERRFLIRRNAQAFKDADDPIELRRWLETALSDFYHFVGSEASELAKEISSNSEALREKTPVCKEWQESGLFDSGRTIKLCGVGAQAILVEGEYQQVKEEKQDRLPLKTEISATLKLVESRGQVKPVKPPIR